MFQGSGNDSHCSSFQLPQNRPLDTGEWGQWLPQLPVHTCGLATGHLNSAAENPRISANLLTSSEPSKPQEDASTHFCLQNIVQVHPISRNELIEAWLQGHQGNFSLSARKAHWKEVGIHVPKFSTSAKGNPYRILSPLPQISPLCLIG